MAPVKGNGRVQDLRALGVAKGPKREALEKEEEEEGYLPKELAAQVDVSEEGGWE